MQFDLTTLRVFLTVAEEQNIAHAAEREHMAASAISKRIADLERTLDVRLFVRHHGGVRLTAAGLVLADHARSMFTITDRIRTELSTYASGAKGHVRLAANSSSITQFLAPSLARFLKSNPEVHVELLEQTSERTVQMLVDRAIDLGIVAGDVDFRGMASIEFRRDALAMMVHRRHPLARRRRVAFAETLDFDQVGLAEESSIQRTLSEAARRLNGSINLKVRAASFDVLRRLVEADIGIACLPVGCIKPFVRTHGLAIVPLTDPWADRQIKVCVRDFADCPEPARRLLSALGVST